MVWVSQTQPVRRRVLILLKLQIGTNNIVTREVGITGALKFKNCHFTVTVAKENKRVRSVWVQSLCLVQKHSLLLLML
jgi:hypothetical protein